MEVTAEDQAEAVVDEFFELVAVYTASAWMNLGFAYPPTAANDAAYRSIFSDAAEVAKVAWEVTGDLRRVESMLRHFARHRLPQAVRSRLQ